jgi:hypothetical protein
MITKFGRRFITSCLAGLTTFTKQDLAFGIVNTSPDVNGDDTRLGFEFYRIPVTFGSIDIQQTGTVNGNPVFGYIAVYKTTLPQDIAGKISEIGLYPSNRTSMNNYDSKILADFENSLLWNDINGYSPELIPYSESASINPRVGSYLLKSTTAASASREFYSFIPSIDISGYSGNDTIAFAFHQEDTNLNSIKIKFYSSDTSYLYMDITGSELSTSGAKIISKSVSSLQSYGSPNTYSITKIGVEVTAKSTGSTVVYFDALRVNDEDTFDPTFGLISRSVFTSGNELIKEAGKPVDVEYRLELNF